MNEGLPRDDSAVLRIRSLSGSDKSRRKQAMPGTTGADTAIARNCFFTCGFNSPITSQPLRVVTHASALPKNTGRTTWVVFEADVILANTWFAGPRPCCRH